MTAAKKSTVVEAPTPMSDAVVEDEGKRLWFTRGGQRWALGVDGRLWRRAEGLVTAVVPVKVEDYREMLGISKKDEESVLEKVDKGGIPSAEVVRSIAEHMLGIRDTECFVMLGKHRETGKFAGFCPKQEVSGAHFDVNEKDVTDACAMMQEMNYRWIGGLHTHPGTGTYASGTDLDFYREMPGIHFIVGRDVSVSLYASVRGTAWRLDETMTLPETLPEKWYEEHPVYTRGGVAISTLLSRRIGYRYGDAQTDIYPILQGVPETYRYRQMGMGTPWALPRSRESLDTDDIEDGVVQAMLVLSVLGQMAIEAKSAKAAKSIRHALETLKGAVGEGLKKALKIAEKKKEEKAGVVKPV